MINNLTDDKKSFNLSAITIYIQNRIKSSNKLFDLNENNNLNGLIQSLYKIYKSNLIQQDLMLIKEYTRAITG